MSEAYRVRDILRDHNITIPRIGPRELSREELTALLEAEGRVGNPIRDLLRALEPSPRPVLERGEFTMRDVDGRRYRITFAEVTGDAG